MGEDREEDALHEIIRDANYVYYPVFNRYGAFVGDVIPLGLQGISSGNLNCE